MIFATLEVLRTSFVILARLRSRSLMELLLKFLAMAHPRFTLCCSLMTGDLLIFIGKDRGYNALQGNFQSLGSERFNQMCLKAGTFAFG